MTTLQDRPAKSFCLRCCHWERYMGLPPTPGDENNHGGHGDHGENFLKTNSVSSAVNDFRRSEKRSDCVRSQGDVTSLRMTAECYLCEPVAPLLACACIALGEVLNMLIRFGQ